MPALETKLVPYLLTGPPNGLNIGGDGVALLGLTNIIEGLLPPQVNKRELFSNQSPSNSIESIRTRVRVEEMKLNDDLQVPDLFNTKKPITRRDFLRLTGIAVLAIALTSCSPAIKPIIHPTPTPSKDKYPPPIPDAEYQKLTNRARITKLVSCNIPESWKDLNPRDLMSRFESEIRETLLPELCGILGCLGSQTKCNTRKV